ncbi:hypothetical protein VE00_08517 [Pseudogymnoascus sp. WSF 3629]|nr:hypothetical protein VE00_08517 [Pseudogymnoascus sp. WSF 3629]
MSTQVDPDQFTTPFLLTKTLHRDPYPAILPENPHNSQKGKIIIITGGGGGLGAAAAKVWARAGATGIVIAARRTQNLMKVSDEIKAINPDITVLQVKADITSEDDVKSLFAAVKKTFKRPADVLLNNAGYMVDDQLIGETPVDDWWKGFEINLKGLYIMVQHFIQAQPNQKAPTGTVITVSSGRAGLTNPGGSAYNISKLAEERLSEHIQIEYPTLRVFTTMPGIAATDMTTGFWEPYALDHVDLGSMVGVNWDVEEMEQHKKEIVDKKLLQTAWLPILPLGGGSGLGK